MFAQCKFGKVGILSKHGFDSAYFVKIWKSTDIKNLQKSSLKKPKSNKVKGRAPKLEKRKN